MYKERSEYVTVCERRRMEPSPSVHLPVCPSVRLSVSVCSSVLRLSVRKSVSCLSSLIQSPSLSQSHTSVHFSLSLSLTAGPFSLTVCPFLSLAYLVTLSSLSQSVRFSLVSLSLSQSHSRSVSLSISLRPSRW